MKMDESLSGQAQSLKSSHYSHKDNPMQVESLTRSQGLNAIENEIARIQAKYPHIKERASDASTAAGQDALTE